ncbi:MAG: HTH domain-containing protein [Dehalococcoidia bacterium]|nr:HTH domain-containing protein [Dehalococcoidia bacterium]
MRAARLVTILLMLQDRGRVTAGELARALEVSVRTVHRDLEALSAGGVPVYAERGAAGGFQLLEGYRPRLGGFTTTEIEALWMLGDPPLARALGLEAARASAALKLIEALPEPQRAAARAAAARILVTDPPERTPGVPESWLRGLAEAATTGRVVRLTRPSRGVGATTEFEPLGLVRSGLDWHAVGRVDGEVTAVPLTEVTALASTARRFTPDGSFDLGAWWQRRA